MSDAPPRLYLATPQTMAPEDVAERLSKILPAIPIACVRLERDSTADEAAWTQAVNHLQPICHEADVPLIITDHYRLVTALGLDGVHLAIAKTPVRDVRKALGPDLIVGAAAGASTHQGMTMADAGADYVSFGPAGDPGALGDAERADAELFEWWSQVIETPCVAEGHVTLAEATALASTADFVIPDPQIWADADDPVAALQPFSDALPPLEEEET